MKQSMITIPPGGIGEVSDGYHTFNELYHHRAILFSALCNANKEKAWKSKSHHDGTMFADMFIVGIDTPQGQASYHYDVNPYWDMFDVPALGKAPEWDGHTAEMAINRIAMLAQTGMRSLTPEESADYKATLHANTTKTGIKLD